MDKCIWICFIAFLLCISGCNTIRNTTQGALTGIGATGYGFTKGLADDVYNAWTTLDKADKWFQEYYW
ncbi:MAG: hypothetical protein JSW40_02785 [Candidatus Omnitrophota bacterium]|nr:MAG: hypothetical protein JSW40_02785 [Candidatus Omnitrophota bacterium]